MPDKIISHGKAFFSAYDTGVHHVEYMIELPKML